MGRQCLGQILKKKKEIERNEKVEKLPDRKTGTEKRGKGMNNYSNNYV